jgi:hypothetical protein
MPFAFAIACSFKKRWRDIRNYGGEGLEVLRKCSDCHEEKAASAFALAARVRLTGTGPA